MVKVKICGIKNSLDALTAIKAGAFAIGEVLAPSPREINIETAAKINYEISDYKVLKVGVFVNEDISNLKYIVKTANLDIVQLHGDEPPEYIEEIAEPVIKAFAINTAADLEKVKYYKPWAYLFDTKVTGKIGGTGISFDWDLIKNLKLKKLILAGGLNPHNVKEAINLVKPWAVDVSSGVENNIGNKDSEKIRAFIKEVREVNKYVTRY